MSHRSMTLEPSYLANFRSEHMILCIQQIGLMFLNALYTLVRIGLRYQLFC